MRPVVFIVRRLRDALHPADANESNELACGVGLEGSLSRFVLFYGIIKELGIALNHFTIGIKLGLHTSDLGTDGVRCIGSPISFQRIDDALDLFQSIVQNSVVATDFLSLCTNF